jgi:hypothetical protein
MPRTGRPGTTTKRTQYRPLRLRSCRLSREAALACAGRSGRKSLNLLSKVSSTDRTRRADQAFPAIGRLATLAPPGKRCVLVTGGHHGQKPAKRASPLGGAIGTVAVARTLAARHQGRRAGGRRRHHRGDDRRRVCIAHLGELGLDDASRRDSLFSSTSRFSRRQCAQHEAASPRARERREHERDEQSHDYSRDQRQTRPRCRSLLFFCTRCGEINPPFVNACKSNPVSDNSVCR